jgi:hypothetical protein
MERGIVAVVSQATFPPATGAKRFIRDLTAGYIQQLSPRGRWFLAFIAHRFRRQYTLSAEQWQWVNEHKSQEPARNCGKNEPTSPSGVSTEHPQIV